MQKVIGYVLDRMVEASTWRGIILFCTGALGMNISPDVATGIVSLGMSLAGALGMLMPDKRLIK